MSLFPFGLPVNKDIILKKRDQENGSAKKYEQQLTDYRETLESYKKCIIEYADKLEGLDNRSIDHKLTIMRTTLDLTYIKEQTDKMMELIEMLRNDDNVKLSEQQNQILTQGNRLLEHQESMLAGLVETNYKLEGLDNNVVNRLSDVFIELQKQTIALYKQSHQELQDKIYRISKSVKHNKVLLWFLFISQVIGLGGIAFIILYLLEVIVI